MSEALSSIGTWLGSDLGKGLMTAGTAGAGLAQNLMAYRKQKQVQDLIADPKKFNAMVAATEQPLSQGLVSSVGRQADAYGAERGLGSSPYIMKDVMAQALAPYQQQAQTTAMNSVLERLGLMARNPALPIDMTSIFKALATMGKTPNYNYGTWGGGSVGGVPDPALATPGYTPGGGPTITAPSYMNLPASALTPQVDINTGDFGSLVPTLMGGGDMGMAV